MGTPMRHATGYNDGSPTHETSEETMPEDQKQAGDFIREIVARDLADGRVGQVHTRFPPSRTATCTSATPRAST